MTPARMLLYRCAPFDDDAGLAAWQALGRAEPTLRLYRAIEGGELYAYVASPTAHLPTAAVPTPLHLTLDVAGASAGTTAPWHYAVETDVLPEFEREFNAWYEEEHLPGLAAVPGTVRAMRFLNPAGSPRYHACYDLASLETFGSPAWIAVRATPWSSRVRLAFRNTKRTMFQRLWLGPHDDGWGRT